MNGVTILSQYKTVVGYVWGWNWYGVLFFCLAAFFFGLLIMTILHSTDMLPVTAYVLTMVFLIAGAMVQENSIPVYETRVTALIDNTCDITELFNKYEIVEKHGNMTYVLREISEKP